MSSWDACTREPSGFLRWIECHPATSGAAQDVLLLLTIIVAIAVPTWLAERERCAKRTEWRTQSEIFARALLGPASQVLADFPRIRAVIRMWPTSGLGGPYTAPKIREAKISIPRRVGKAMEIIHTFDPAVVAPLQGCFTGLESYNVCVEQFAKACVQDVNAAMGLFGNFSRMCAGTLDQLQFQLEAITGTPLPPPEMDV